MDYSILPAGRLQKPFEPRADVVYQPGTNRGCWVAPLTTMEDGMAHKNMTMEEMQQVTASLVDPKNPAHQALMKIPRLAGLITDIKSAHGNVLELAPVESDPKARELAELAQQTDEVHDTLVRGIHGFLTQAALLVDQGEKLLALRDQLFPNGLAAVVNATYRGQAGFAARLSQQLTDTTRLQMKGIALPDGTNLLDRVEAWLAAGDRLGKLEEERSRLETKNSPSLAGRMADARNRWVRVMNVVVDTAALAEIDADTDRIVFGPLRDAEKRADERSARRSAAALPAEEPAEGGAGAG